MVLTPHQGNLLFANANTLQADYLFHGNPYDLGAGTIGCGRRPDALKMFLAWKFYGRQGLGRRIDQAIEAATAFTDLVRSRPSLKLVKDPSLFCQVSFWVMPHGLESQVEEWKKDPAVYKEKMTLVTRTVHARVNQSGEFLVDHAPLDGVPNFFRIVINAPTVSVQRDLAHLLDAIEAANRDIPWSQVLA